MRLDERVRKAFEARKGRSGSPGLARDLSEQGHDYNRKTVAESPRRQGLRAKAAKKFKATASSRHHLPVATNLLGQDFTATAPNHKWVCDALQMALWRRGLPRGVIVHSDRGSQYCSASYQSLLRHHDLLCSMSAKGNCYDNACAASFFHTLKVECIHGERFAAREDMKQAVFEYIEVDYNRTRRHSANGYISPMAFEAQQVA